MAVSRSILVFTILLALLPAGSVSARPLKNDRWRVSFFGYGPLKIGMPLTKAQEMLGTTLAKMEKTAEDEGCRIVSNEKDLPGLSFMVIDEKIVVIYVSSDIYQTVSGAKIGMKQMSIEKLYPRNEVKKHPYGGDYVLLKDKSGKNSLLFEFSSEKNVSSFKVGLFPYIEFFEGCH